jgi:hypothetical protein
MGDAKAVKEHLDGKAKQFVDHANYERDELANRIHRSREHLKQY